MSTENMNTETTSDLEHEYVYTDKEAIALLAKEVRVGFALLAAAIRDVTPTIRDVTPTIRW